MLDFQVIIPLMSPTESLIGKLVILFEIISSYVELSQQATNTVIESIISVSSDEATNSSLQALKVSYDDEGIARWLSVPNILERYPLASISLGACPHMFPPMCACQYSISSSPLWNQWCVTLTVSVIDSPSCFRGTRAFLGVASNYLWSHSW